MAGELTRVARTAPATLTHVFVIDETATDSSGTVTVAVSDVDGNAVDSGNATRTGPGTYTYALSGQSTLNRLLVSWTGTFGSSSVVETDYVEVVGGFFFNLAQARGSDDTLTDTNKYTTVDLKAKRQQVEDECEMICDRAFVPRYRRAVLDGTGTPDILMTDDTWAKQGRSAADIRVIRAASVAPQVGQTFVPLTAGQLGALVVTADNMLRRVDGAIWTEGVQNIVLEYEFGWDAPPSDLVEASLLRLRSRLQQRASGVPDRATSYTATDGGTYRLDMPAAFKTGLPMVDAVYSRYSRRSGSGTGTTGRPVVASRTMTYNPQTNSLFHTPL